MSGLPPAPRTWRQNAHGQSQGKTLDGRGGKPKKYTGGDKSSQIAVADGCPGPAKPFVNGLAQRFSGTQFFLEAFENKYVGIHGNSQRKDEPGNAGQGESDRDQFE